MASEQWLPSASDYEDMLPREEPNRDEEVASLQTALAAATAKLDIQSLRRDHWSEKCQTCGKQIGDFHIYLEDCDGKMRDGWASILANFVFCSPRCLKQYAESYGAQ